MKLDAAEAISQLRAAADPGKAAEMAAYHKAPREYLGLAVPAVEAAVAGWRGEADLPARVVLAGGLWDSDIHEARIAAAKLLTQARLGDGDPLVWAEFLRWVPDFDAWAIADHACKAGERRLGAVPDRLDTVETWIRDPNMWVRRAAMVATLPWTRQNHPTPAEEAARDRILGWAATLAPDRDWFIQKAIGWWLRSLSLHDPERVATFLAGPGVALKPFARREAIRRMPPSQSC
ncbi:MAG: DNA alkylation repair protein [Amaricoccus sp.]|uniref:DNA alkylation repair protein n=1 Tax=Amaricoccus sp. TaxID=1872485 RepID=UPI003315D514